MVAWETGEISEEPLSIIAQDNRVTCAAYCSDIRNVAVTSPILTGLRNRYFCIPSTTNNLMNNQDPKFSAPPKDYTNIDTILDPKLRTQDRKQAHTPVGTSTGLFHNPRYGKVIIPN